jgi:hypothetical protein
MKGSTPALLLAALLVAPIPAPSAPVPDFDHTVAPLLAEHCLDCHGGPRPKGKLDLSTHKAFLKGGRHGPILVSGRPDESRLWQYVRDGKMPPKKPLPAAERQVLRDWIATGARWGNDPIDPFRLTTGRRAGYDWWALRPVRRPPLPVVKAGGWARNPIDVIVLHRLEGKGLRPASPADRRTLIRRLSFDLLGLPPRPEEVAAFQQDPAPDAYERLVDRYLASPHYGERWARHWLDVVRFGESNGFEFNEFRPNAWRFRDWVVGALNADLPFDEFARLQVAGDVVRPHDPAAVEATGFLVAGAYDTVGQTQQSAAMRRVVRQDELEDVVGTVGQTFLGLTVNCARCHDHKLDPVRQVEYYRLTAALAGVRQGERDLTGLDPEAVAATARIAKWTARVAALEAPVRARVITERRAGTVRPPAPIARWDFRKGLKDQVGGLHGTLHGKARLTPEGLLLDGASGYVSTRPLERSLTAKTLEAWVRLRDLDQRGGGVLSVETPDGSNFDAIVFGEIEPRRWMAGSDDFVRTQSFHGPAEDDASRRVVHVAITYAPDGAVTGYRDGQVYGQTYHASFPLAFQAGHAKLLFGLRHGEPTANRLLAGVIVQARLYDRALSPEQVAASAGVVSTHVTPEAVQARLSAADRKEWQTLQTRIDAERGRLARLSRQAYAVTPRQPETAHLLLRGNPAQPAQVVSAGGVAAVAGLTADFGLPPDAPEGERRRRLAAWITDRHNPLFARVIVNRLWQYHFGTGIVSTPNDFGFNGSRPSHPELLDWLADELVGSGWSLKHVHRAIVLSATYRQSGRRDAAAARLDADNRLLWRQSPRRLEAEAVRDAMLAVAGRLNTRMGGPSFQAFQVTRAAGTAAMFYTPADAVGFEAMRRTLYRATPRGSRAPLLDVLDCPDPSAAAPRRGVTTTPLQALALLNDGFVLRLADRFAERLAREAADTDGQVRRAYLLAYGRAPRANELELARTVVRRHGLAVLARAIFNSNEFLYVD